MTIEHAIIFAHENGTKAPPDLILSITKDETNNQYFASYLNIKKDSAFVKAFFDL
jgi:hypothetical protein